jgi:ELWxxDGT repeat protein
MKSAATTQSVSKFLNLGLIVVFLLAGSLPQHTAQADSPIPDPQMIGEFNGDVCQNYGPFSYPATLGNKMYFAASDADGLALWVSDGTAGSTYAYYPFPGATCVKFSGVVTHGKMVFTVKTGDQPSQLYVSDGTAAGTGFLADISVDYIVAYRGLAFLLVFGDYSAGTMDQLWRTDGTPEGTIKLADLGGYFSGDAFIFPFIEVHSPFTNEYSLWYSDGTVGGTFLVVKSDDGYSVEPISDDTTILFSRVDDELEIWTTHNIPGDMEKLTSFPDQYDMNQSVLGAANGLAFFFIKGPTDENHDFLVTLWQTDGTIEGTVQVDPYVAYTGYGLKVYHQFDFNNSLFFVLYEDYVYRLCVIQGKDRGGVKELYTFPKDPRYYLELVPFQGKLYFLEKYDGRETIFVTDGLTAGPIGFPAVNFIESGGLAASRFGFMTFDASFEGEYNNGHVFYSDGTEDGTHILFSPDESTGARYPNVYGESSTSLFFTTRSLSSDSQQLWASVIQEQNLVYLPVIVH